MRFTPPSVGTVARGNAPGGGKEAGRRAQRGGQPFPPAGGRRALAQRARAVRRLFLRPQPAPSPPGAAGSLAPSCPQRNVPGWAWVRLLTRPARPAPTTRPDPEAEGAVPAVAGAWPRPVAGRGSAGRGAGPGLLQWEPAPFPFLRSSAARPGCPHPLWSPRPSPPSPGAPGPGCSHSPFLSGPSKPVSPCLQLHVPLSLWTGQSFRSLVQRDSWRHLDLSGGDFALRAFEGSEVFGDTFVSSLDSS